MDVINNSISTLLILLLPLSVVALAVSKQSGSATLDCRKETKAALRGQNVILTGASSGLGKALAFQLAKSDVKTLVLSGRNVEELGKVKSQCEEIMSKSSTRSTNLVATIICDLLDEKSVSKFSDEAMSVCEEKADMLILCGGISSRSSFLETSPNIDRMLMQVNFLSGSAISKRVVPSMVKNKQGSIVWISSVQGLLGTPFRTSYAASKFAVQGYCEALRAELSSSNVRVSCVSPGYIRTNLSTGAIRGDGSKHGQLDESTAKGADPNDVAVEILDSTVEGKTDFIVAATLSAKVALGLKFLAPSVLQKLLVKRFEKASIIKTK